MQSERLKPEEFDEHIKNGTFRLAFIGMSNGGKSYRSRILRDEAGFLWYHVDEEIQKALGFKAMGEISHWLGYPMSKGYKEREQKYLETENVFTERASMQTNGKNLVFDTTGSVIHLKEKTLDTLRSNCLVVHLDVGEESLPQMVELFFKEPKPIAWAGNFDIQPAETEEAALRRCYPKLLVTRLAKYRDLAHVSIPALQLHDTSASETLAIIRAHLA